MGVLYISNRDYPDLVEEFRESPMFKVTDIREEGRRATYKEELRRGFNFKVEDSEDGGGEDMESPSLPAGIYSEGDAYSRESFLDQRGLICSSFNRDDYESGEMDREPQENFERLFNLNSQNPIWNEPRRLPKDFGSVDGYERYCQRFDRWTMLTESFLSALFIWLQDEAAPALSRYITKNGNKTFRFVNPAQVLKSLENGPPVKIIAALRGQILCSGWQMLMEERFKFNKIRKGWEKNPPKKFDFNQGVPDKTWLSAENMHLLRQVFIALADHFCVSEGERPKIVENLKVEDSRQKLMLKLDELNDRQERGMVRLRYLVQKEILGPVKAAVAIKFFNDLDEEICLTQDILDRVLAQMVQAEADEELDTELMDQAA